MQHFASLFAYIGPETIVPATSALAAIVGILLAFGRSATRPFVAGFFWLIGRKCNVETAAVPSGDAGAVSESQAPLP